MRILHRYILKEMLKALALSMPAISGVFSFAVVLATLQSQGLSPSASLKFMVLSFPGSLHYALPLSAVLVTTLIYGRLTVDNEIMACRASGIPLSSLLWPVVLLALMASGASLVLASWPLPECGYAAKKLTLADAKSLFFSRLSNGRINIKEANFQMTVDRVVGDMLYGPTIKHRGNKGAVYYCYAPYGRLEFDDENKVATLSLWEAIVIDKSNAMPVRGTHKISLPLPTVVPRRAEDLSLWYLIAVQRNPGLADDIRMLSPDTAPKEVQLRKDIVRAQATAEFHGRLASALGCLGLVLLGAGLGIYFNSGHLLTAFGVALAPWLSATLLTKMAVWAVGDSAANPQRLVWLIWGPNVLVLAMGAVAIAGVVWFWGHPVRLHHRLFGLRPAAAAAPSSTS
jgi:lipopolysaccharide export system permease protein